MNSIHLISPYKIQGQWVFDDASKELDKEPFVAGADDIIEQVVQEKELGDEFNLLFSKSPFPGYQYTLEWIRGGPHGGNWYNCHELWMEGWLCPALLKYFGHPPELIFVQFKEKK